MNKRIGVIVGLLALVALFTPNAIAAADPEAAERQYRIARRLAAEGSAEAVGALERVIALDPKGELVDNALVDHALLLGTATWPEELGQVTADAAAQAAALLDRVLAQHAGEDRAVEARYLRALARLEPLAGYDASTARLELLGVASFERGGAWDRRARYVRAWLDERQGNDKRARATYQRLLVDAPDSASAQRARVGQARVLLRSGDYGEAAALVQVAVDAGMADAPTLALRELAVRSLLRGGGAADRVGSFETVVAETGIRQLVGMATFPDGGVLLAGRRAGVLRFGVSGHSEGRWDLDQIHAVAVSADGSAYAAAGEQVYRLDPGAQPRPVAGLGPFYPVSALTIDGEGRFWVLDRKGDRLGVLDRGSNNPSVVWEVKGQRLAAVEWDGATIVALDAKQKTLRAIDRNGGARPLATTQADRPSALATDASGRLAVLDSRAGVVHIVAADYGAQDSVSLENAGVARPAAVRFGQDGRLHVFDGASGAWLRTP